MKTIKIVGVPEHFNMPWYQSIADRDFERVGVDLQWTDIPEGTGKMCQMLRSGETDMAVVLTEGMVKDILGGCPAKIVQVYVATPLLWGIHVGGKSAFQEVSDLQQTTAAISRFGSGSHLMAYVHAQQQGWDTATLQFQIVHTLEGAVEALQQGTADYFMWERFMTQPIVDSGVFRRLGVCPTPWPCFVIAVRDEVLANENEAVQSIVNTINTKTQHFKAQPHLITQLAQRFHQKEEALEAWLSCTEWSQNPLSEKEFELVQNHLWNLNLIDKKDTFATVVNLLK
ncbi:MAG: substrate-binding domain-containing protein [Flavobacterium sp.]|uniref:substrate-binding domain-containing protein n=1 Tax=Flavobacterium sp. TaxID=239 RepID=UPI0022C7B3B7|nr:substrate-binding domain-containing protein [Flavobacterium sp.]MCZ8296317.1 substrate-binding domain-containing protein [Flavobacterium sp.]